MKTCCGFVAHSTLLVRQGVQRSSSLLKEIRIISQLYMLTSFGQKKDAHVKVEQGMVSLFLGEREMLSELVVCASSSES